MLEGRDQRNCDLQVDGEGKKKKQSETVTSWQPKFTRIAHSKSSARELFYRLKRRPGLGRRCSFFFYGFRILACTQLRFYSAITADRLDTATRSNVGVIASWHSRDHKQYEKEVAEITTIIVPNSENAAIAIFGNGMSCAGYSRYKRFFAFSQSPLDYYFAFRFFISFDNYHSYHRVSIYVLSQFK